MSLPPLDPRANRAHEYDVGRRRWVVVIVGSVAGMIVVAAVVSAWLLGHRSAAIREVDRPRSVGSPRFAPDGPPLQPSLPHDRTPGEDLAAMHAREDAVFAAMGWRIDPATHAAVVPDAVIARVAARPGPSPVTRPTTRASTVTPVPGIDEGGPR